MKSPIPPSINGAKSPLTHPETKSHYNHIMNGMTNEIKDTIMQSPKLIHRNWKKVRSKTISLALLAIMLAIIPREGWPRQNQFNYNIYVKHSIVLHNRTKTDKLKNGHTKLSKQFVRSNHSYSQQYKMPSSSSTTRSSRLKRSDIESNERVEKIL